MKFKIYLLVLCLVNRLLAKKEDPAPAIPVQPVRTNLAQNAEEKTKFPENLTDGNQDGQVDEGDFIRAFSGTGLTNWEISQIFGMADFRKAGNLDMQQWKLFRNLFIKRFEEFDKDNDLLLQKAQIIESLKDIPGLNNIVKNETIFEVLVNDLSGRHPGKDDGEDGLNLYEWTFLRSVGVSWQIASGNKDTITKDELLDVAEKVMPHFTAYEGQLKQTLFRALDVKDMKFTYDFIETANILHKFAIFESMRKHSSISGAMGQGQLQRCVDDGVGPTKLFEVQDQDKMFNLMQLWNLKDDDEEIGIDFPSFYYLMRGQSAVKQYGKTKYGAMVEAEFKDMMKKHPFFNGMLHYMENSFLMKDDYAAKKDYTTESEAYLISGGVINPMQYRFAQKSHKHYKQNENHHNKLFRFKKVKKEDAEAKKDKTAEDFKLTDEDPLHYFFMSFNSHVYDQTMTWSDVFRLFKYYRRFQAWDSASGTRTFRVYPNQLTKQQINESETIFFLREKQIIQGIIMIYKANKKVDRVQFNLPLDFLGFVRFFAYQNVVTAEGKVVGEETISYDAFFRVCQRMGLVPIGMDVSKWTKDLTQGMNAFKPIFKPSENEKDNLRMVNGWKAFEAISIHASYQLAGKVQFNDHKMHPNLNSYSQTRGRRRKLMH